MKENQLDIVLKNSDLSGLATKYIEILTDNLLDNELLKDLPIIDTVVKIMRFSNSLNQYFFTKKLYKFLFELKSIPEQKRKEMVKRINGSKKYQSSVGEMVLEQIDKIDSDYKPEILGRLFKAFLMEKFDYETYLKLAYIIKTCFYYDLIDLNKKIKGSKIYGSYSFQMEVLGIASTDHAQYLDDHTNWEGPVRDTKDSYSSLTELGELLFLYGLEQGALD